MKRTFFFLMALGLLTVVTPAYDAAGSSVSATAL